MTQIVFVGAKRTPFGSFGKTLSQLSATDLGVEASKAAIAHSGASPDKIDHVLFGNVIQSSSDAAYLARHIGLKTGGKITTPAVTINRLCGSGFESIIQGASLIKQGEATTILAGGTENMTQAPYVLRNARFGYRMGNGDLEDALVSGLFDAHANIAMSGTAEALAEKYSISREQCDELSLHSQTQALRATEDGTLAEEIVPIKLKVRRKEIEFAKDEHFRADASLESLAKLRPVFKKDGVVTAGNASGISDGAAAVVLTTLENATKEGWSPLGELVASHVVGCDPSEMGLGPVGACQGVLAKSGLKLSDMKCVEINEAFASQYLAVEKELGLNREITNMDGGAIALGHPLAASGARITLHLLYRLKKLGGGYGLGSACIGGGQGIAVIVKV